MWACSERGPSASWASASPEICPSESSSVCAMEGANGERGRRGGSGPVPASLLLGESGPVTFPFWASVFSSIQSLPFSR